MISDEYPGGIEGVAASERVVRLVRTATSRRSVFTVLELKLNKPSTVEMEDTRNAGEFIYDPSHASPESTIAGLFLYEFETRYHMIKDLIMIAVKKRFKLYCVITAPYLSHIELSDG